MSNSEEESFLKNIWNKIKNIYDVIYELGSRMSDHKIFILAAGIAFNIVLYTIPLVLILVSFINIFLEPDELIVTLQQVTEQYLPNQQNYTTLISNTILEIETLATSSKIAGAISFVILLWLSSILISTLNSCISHIFQFEQPHYFRTKLKDLGTTLLLNILIILYGVLLPTIGFATSLIESIFPEAVGF
jgi:uncharacterized BrkB/YihY/UPF0761 family membrane protein